MSRRLTALLLCCALEMPAAVAVGADPEGRTFYLRYCAACHGNDARGHGRVAEALVKPPSDLTRIAERRGGKYPASEVAALIDGRQEIRAHGGSDMPVWGTLLRQELDDRDDPDRRAVGIVQSIVEYLGTIQAPAK